MITFNNIREAVFDLAGDKDSGYPVLDLIADYTAQEALRARDNERAFAAETVNPGGLKPHIARPGVVDHSAIPDAVTEELRANIARVLCHHPADDLVNGLMDQIVRPLLCDR